MQRSDWLQLLFGVLCLGAGAFLSTFSMHTVRLIGIALTVLSACGIAAWFVLGNADIRASHWGPWVLILGGPIVGFVWLLLRLTGEVSLPPALEHKPEPTFIWDTHLGHSYSGGGGAVLITKAFQIGVVNNLGHELRIDRAYAVSGEGAGEKSLLVAADIGWVSGEQTLPIASGQKIIFRIEFGDVPSAEIYRNWKTFQITINFNTGMTERHNISEDMVLAVYRGFTPDPIGPQVRAKP